MRMRSNMFAAITAWVFVSWGLGCAPQRHVAREVPGTVLQPAASVERSTEPRDIIGSSVQGRPIEAVSVGGSGVRILIIGSIHGDEPEGGRTVNALIAYLRVLSPNAAVRIVRDANPDGTAAGSRTNANGVDLNRNWPARNYRPGGSRGREPMSEPETRVLFAEIERFGPELVLVCHAARGGPFVNYDGPAAGVASAFARGAATSDPRWRVKPSMGYPTPGSLGSYLGVDRGVPILTIEFARGADAEAAWAAMRDGVSEVLGKDRQWK